MFFLTIGDTLDGMTTSHDTERVPATSDTFNAAPEIPFTSPVGDITQAVIEYGESGVPCVITGFPFAEDDEQSPFCQSAEWIKSIHANRSRPVPQIFVPTFFEIP